MSNTGEHAAVSVMASQIIGQSSPRRKSFNLMLPARRRKTEQLGVAVKEFGVTRRCPCAPENSMWSQDVGA